MGKAAKWLRSLLTGKKEKEQKWGQSPAMTPIIMRSGPLPMMPPPKEKKRWSFRRSVTGTAMEQKAASVNNNVRGHFRGNSDSELDRRRADAAVIRLTNTATVAVEEAAAVKIQSVFRSYLARKALFALKGLVKLQALIRGHLVRRQATATLRSMQAMVTAQARARLQRIRMLEEAQAMSHHRQNNHRRSPQTRQSYVTNQEQEENVKIVEMDIGENTTRASSKSRSNYLSAQAERRDHRLATYSGSSTPYKREASPARSILTDKSPRASGHFGEYYYFASESSPPYLSTPPLRDSMKSLTTALQDHNPFFPNYMANTESSRAKSRSHSAPRQRPDSYERQPGRRSISGARPQQPSSYLSSATPEGYRYPWSIKLDRSSVSLQESECESMSSILTNAKYARSLMACEVHSELALNINSFH